MTQDIIEEMAVRMHPVCSAKEALERIEKYLDAPLPPRTAMVRCKAAIRKWRESGSNR